MTLGEYLEMDFSDAFIESSYSLFEQGINYRIVLEDAYIHIPALNINIHSGFYESKEENGDYYTDFDFYMFFDSSTKEHLYEEQGSGIAACIHNYATAHHKPLTGKCIDTEQLQIILCPEPKGEQL